MGRRPIVRNTVLQVLKDDKALRFKDLKSGIEKKLGKKIHNDTLAGALAYLLEQGMVEKRLENGVPVYRLTQNYYNTQLYNKIRDILEMAKGMDVENGFFDPIHAPFIILYESYKRIENYSVGYFIYFKYTATDEMKVSPEDLIAENMLDVAWELDTQKCHELRRFLSSAYWLGVQRIIQSHNLYDSLNRLLEQYKAGRSRPGGFSKNVIKIFKLTLKLINKENLYDFLKFLIDNTPEIRRLQPPRPGLEEEIWFDFLNFHDVIRGVLPEFVETTLLIHPHSYWYYSLEVWNKFIKDLILTMTPDAVDMMMDRVGYVDAQSMFDPPPINIDEAKRIFDEYMESSLEFLKQVINRSKIIIIYAWGYPEIFELQSKMILVDFQNWLSALRSGDLDHRGYFVFTEENLKLVASAWRKVRKGRPPQNKGLDLQERWTLLDIYLHHPRGKDPEFWEELYNLLKAKLEERRRKRENSLRAKRLKNSGNKEAH